MSSYICIFVLIGKGKDNKNLITMCKRDIFAEILKDVSEVTEVPEDIIASGDRCAESVDARYLLVYFLHRRGFYASAISKFIGHRKRSVNQMISNFETRMQNAPMMRVDFERLRKKWGGQ